MRDKLEVTDVLIPVLEAFDESLNEFAVFLGVVPGVKIFDCTRRILRMGCLRCRAKLCRMGRLFVFRNYLPAGLSRNLYFVIY